MHQWSGNLFFRGVCPDVIDRMSYQRLRYWNEWHERAAKKDRADYEQMKRKK